MGSHKTDTMLRGHIWIDYVVVLKTMPTVESVNALAEHLQAELEKVGHFDGAMCCLCS